MTNNSAAFLGVGIHTCLGNGISSNLRALQQAPRPETYYTPQISTEELRIPYKLLHESPLQNPEERLYRVIEDVVEQALTEAKLTNEERSHLGLFIGSSSFDISVTEAQFQNKTQAASTAVNEPITLNKPSIGNLADNLVQSLGLKGPDYSFSTACTSSANALLAAAVQIETGLLKHALILGVELYNDLTALGFHNLGLLSPDRMKPFDDNRNGMILGESISALVIGRNDDNRSDKFYLKGGCNLSDTHSITSVAPGGESISAVMQQALVDADLEADQIDGLKVHGTASLSSDDSEAAGMHRQFAQMPKLCALKPYIGHTLGACGLTELILFYRSLEAGFFIATAGISAQPGELEIQLNQTYDAAEPGNFVLNYFGFGGNNTSLIISNTQ